MCVCVFMSCLFMFIWYLRSVPRAPRICVFMCIRTPASREARMIQNCKRKHDTRKRPRQPIRTSHRRGRVQTRRDEVFPISLISLRDFCVSTRFFVCDAAHRVRVRDLSPRSNANETINTIGRRSAKPAGRRVLRFYLPITLTNESPHQAHDECECVCVAAVA